ncbi:hypothetical protein EC960932_3842, partial [Escherichia coli 96.0932]
NCFTCYAWNF